MCVCVCVSGRVDDIDVVVSIVVIVCSDVVFAILFVMYKLGDARQSTMISANHV